MLTPALQNGAKVPQKGKGLKKPLEGKKSGQTERRKKTDQTKRGKARATPKNWFSVEKVLIQSRRASKGK